MGGVTASDDLRSRGSLRRSHREVAKALGISNGVVGSLMVRQKALGLTWEVAQALSDEDLERRFYGPRLLASGRSDGADERKLAALTRPHLLILDDFGLKPLKAPNPEDFYDVISERYEKGSTIITSNRAFAEWAELFGEPLLASAALDRLAHDAHQIVLTGESYRTRPTRRRSAEKRGGNEGQEVAA